MNYLPLAEIHLEPLISILTESFNQPPGKARPWVEASGRENWRVVVDEEPVAGASQRLMQRDGYGEAPLRQHRGKQR